MGSGWYLDGWDCQWRETGNNHRGPGAEPLNISQGEDEPAKEPRDEWPLLCTETKSTVPGRKPSEESILRR